MPALEMEKHMRPITKVHNAVFEPIADLITYRAMPTASVQHNDPFLFLNHHGPQLYPPFNHGLPFGPHPHRGFETVTFILEGDIFHKDSGGNQGTILPGGVQWMTAGSGLIHAEISSEAFKRNGGPLEILQLWVNLPARYKMAAPAYKDLQRADIPVVHLPGAEIQVVSGSWQSTRGAQQSLGDVHISLLHLQAGASLNSSVEAARNIFFYVVRGSVVVNGKPAKNMQLVEFANIGSEVAITAQENTIILFGHALPYNEPIVSHGPFVMNTQQEIMQAFADFRSGKMGVWKE